MKRPLTEWLSAWAIGYASEGFHVLPVRSLDENGRCDCGGSCGADASTWAKHPRTQHGWQDATDNLDRVDDWWTMWPRANIGIATVGDLVVVDLDPRNGADDSWPALVEGRKLPETPMALTGSGGLHYYFRGQVARQGRDALGPGIDLKATVGGRGGYVLAPPSVTVGGRYEWIRVGLPPAPLPDFLHPTPPPKPQLSLNDEIAGSASYAIGALRGEAERAAARNDGEGRRDGLYTAGMKLAHYCPPLNPEQIVAVMTEAGVESGLDRHVAESHIRNGLRINLGGAA